MNNESERRIKQLLSLSDGLQHVRENSIHKQPYTVNVFEFYNSYEPVTSWFLGEILKFRLNNDPIFIKSFIKHFLSKTGFDCSLIKDPIIIAEKEGHIDLVIKEKDYIIIIENKLKGAEYQRNQIARYIKQQSKNYKDEQIYIILLPKYCFSILQYINKLRPSIFNLPIDYNSRNDERHCRHLDKYKCWCDDKSYILTEEQKSHCKDCDKTHLERFNSHIVVIHKELANWMINDSLKLVPENEPILKSIIIQFADFLKKLYNIRDNDKLIKEMEEYLKEQLLDTSRPAIDNWKLLNKKIDEIEKLKAGIMNLRKSISGNVIDEWFEELKPNWPQLKNIRHKSFGIFTQEMWIGCWNGDDNNDNPYWGFWTENEITDKQREIAANIMTEAGIDPETSTTPRFIHWQNTLRGSEECAALYNAAVKLGYLTK